MGAVREALDELEDGLGFNLQSAGFVFLQNCRKSGICIFRCLSSGIAILGGPGTQVGATWAEKSRQMDQECLHRGEVGSNNTKRAAINIQRGAINTGWGSKVSSKF